MTERPTAAVTKANVCLQGAAVLLLSFGIGCGGAGSASTTSDGGATDGSHDKSSSSKADGSKGISSDAKSAADGKHSGTDAKSTPDALHEMDSPVSMGDAGVPPMTDATTTDANPVGKDGAIPPTVDATADAKHIMDAASIHDAESGAAPGSVNLGTAGDYVILSKAGISTVPTSAVTGDLGVSPAAATTITGFGLVPNSSNVFSTSSQVTGKVYAADYAVPTPANLTTAIGDMQAAYTEAAGRPAGVTGLASGDIGGMTLSPGVYKWGSAVDIATNLTLNGDASDVWIFQVAQTLTVANGTQVFLTGGAVPQNVYWEVAGAVTLGTTSKFEGVILAASSIALQTGASIHGRLLAGTAVTLASSTVTQP